MQHIARAGGAGKVPCRRDATEDALPAPTGAMHALLGLLRRGPVPLTELRPAAAAAGMDGPAIDEAFATATRRGAIALVLASGTACVARRRSGA